MSLARRDFLKAGAVAAGAAAVTAGAVKSFIPDARAGEPLPKRFDSVPVEHGDFAAYPPFEK